jgi:hypothetical protein
MDMTIRITRPRDYSGWESGAIGKYNFEAKVYDEPSTFGIKDGRVSKLHVYSMVGGESVSIIEYDRGWSLKPKTAEAKEIMKVILDRYPV